MNLQFSERRRVEELFSMLARPLKNRGYHIYMGGGCRFLQFNPDAYTYEFWVEGNIEPHYEVVINLEHIGAGGQITEPFGCNCLYFMEKKNCKHIAAALYYLSGSNQTIGFQFPLKSTDNPVQGYAFEPISLACNPKNTQEVLAKLRFDQGQTDFYPSSVHAKIGQDQIIYTLTNTYHQYEIQIRAEKDKIVIDSDNKAPYMEKNLLSWLQKRVTEHPEDLQYLTREGQTKAMQSVLDHHQIKLSHTKPHEVLTIVF